MKKEIEAGFAVVSQPANIMDTVQKYLVKMEKVLADAVAH